MIVNKAVFVLVKSCNSVKDIWVTHVTKLVGSDRKETSQVRVESLNQVSINYVAQPHR
jgi:hypothetical protein